MRDQRGRTSLGRKIDAVAKLQVACHEINVGHSAASPFDIGASAARFLLHKPSAYVTQFFAERLVKRRRTKARFADRDSCTLAELQVTCDFASLKIRRVLPRRSSIGDVSNQSAKPQRNRA